MESEERGINLWSDVLLPLWKLKWFIAAFTLAITLGMYGYVSTRPVSYVSEWLLVFSQETSIPNTEAILRHLIPGDCHPIVQAQPGTSLIKLSVRTPNDSADNACRVMVLDTQTLWVQAQPSGTPTRSGLTGVLTRLDEGTFLNSTLELRNGSIYKQPVKRPTVTAFILGLMVSCLIAYIYSAAQRARGPRRRPE